MLAHQTDMNTSDEAVIIDLAEEYFADYTTPSLGGSTAAALIPNGGSRSPVPRAVAVEQIGDVAIADITLIYNHGVIITRIAFIREAGGWRTISPVAH